jgi:hypothetical protein
MTAREADFPNIFLGATAFTMSTELFQQSKSSGKTKWNYVEYYKLAGAIRNHITHPRQAARPYRDSPMYLRTYEF